MRWKETLRTSLWAGELTSSPSWSVVSVLVGAKVPLTLLTGYLGAGKSTLIQSVRLTLSLDGPELTMSCLVQVHLERGPRMADRRHHERSAHLQPLRPVQLSPRSELVRLISSFLS